MLTEIITFGFLATSTFAAQAFSPVHQFGGMLPRGDMAKRQGYYPTTSSCGTGDTCEEACGEGYETCPSQGSGLYCYNPTVGATCCPDGTGSMYSLLSSVHEQTHPNSNIRLLQRRILLQSRWSWNNLLLP
jgi:hypothetical protein